MTFVGEAFRLPRAGKPRLYIIVGTLTSTVPYGIVRRGRKDSSHSFGMTFVGEAFRLPRAGKPRLYIIVGTLTSTVPYGIVRRGRKDSSHSFGMTNGIQFPLLFKSFLYFFHKIMGRDRFQRRTKGKHPYHKLAFVLRHIPQF